MPSFKQLLFSFTIPLLIVFFFLSGCEEKVDCPVCPEPEPLSDYNVYIGVYGSDPGVYIYNTKAMAIVDSIPTLPLVTDLEVTVNEEYLIGSPVGQSGNTWIMDLQTRTIVKEFSFQGEIEISKNGKFIAFDSEPLRIFDATTLEVVFSDSTPITGGHFDPSGDLYYCIKSGNTIVRYDVAGDSALSDIPWGDPGAPGGALRKVVPTQDSNKMFLWVYFGPGWSRVYAYYVAQDSNKIIYEIESQNTDIELTPDGKRLIFTDPFDFIYAASFNVFIADAEHDQLIAIVPTPYIGDPWQQYIINSREIAITPDGKNCILGTLASPWTGMMSIKDREYIDWFRIGTPGSGDYGITVACRKSVN